MLVKATNKYEKLNVKDKELDRVPKAGEEFEVSEERYKVLTETNEYKEVFVEAIEIIETATKKTRSETATKETRKTNK